MNKLKIVSISILSIILIILLGEVSFAATGIVDAPSGLVLRTEASKTAEPITTATDKAEVEIVEEVGEWYKVKYNGHEGYLFAEYVTVKEETVVEEKKEQENTTAEQPTEPTQEAPVETPEYPKQSKLESSIKVYIIPSVTSSVIINIEAQKDIIVNYILNDWANITYENQTGWARKKIALNELVIAEKPQENIENNEQTQPQEEQTEQKQEETATFESKKGYVDVSSSANLRKEANTSAEVLTTLIRNTEVIIVGEEADFYKIQYKDYEGYMAKSLISDKVVEVTSRGSEERKPEKAEQVLEKQEETEEVSNQVIKAPNSGAGQKIADFALKYKGYSYVSGGTTPSGFDCSGFVYYVLNTCGYSLSRSCQVQAKSGTAVSRENLQPGDMVFFCNGSNGSIGHVGIYIGDGKMIHAANSRRGVVTDTINSGYYNKYYDSARRMAN